MVTRITLTHIEWRNQSWIQVKPDRYVEGLSEIIKKITGWGYHKETGWRVPYTKVSYVSLQNLLQNYQIWIEKEKHIIETQTISLPIKLTCTEEEKLAILKLIEKLTIKRYSPNTIRTYKSCLEYFFMQRDKSAGELNAEEIRIFLLKQS